MSMKFFVTAKPSAKEEKVEEIDPTHLRVSVQEPPIQGRANAAIIKAIAKHKGLPSARVRIVAGHTARNKIIEIDLPREKSS